MEINGTQIVPASRNDVWTALNDPAVLRECLPGCESVEQTTADEFRVTVAMAIGPLRARFKGSLRMTEASPPASCVMVFQGEGGAVGFGKGSSSVQLSEVEDGTRVTYTAEAQVGGKLAQVGSRLIDGFAKKMSDDFFNAFRKRLEVGKSDDRSPSPSPTASSAAATAGNSIKVPASQRPSGTDRGSDGGAQGGGTHAHTTPARDPLRTPAAASLAAPAGNSFLVPAWWLGIAMLLGVFGTYAGANWVR